MKGKSPKHRQSLLIPPTSEFIPDAPVISLQIISDPTLSRRRSSFCVSESKVIDEPMDNEARLNKCLKSANRSPFEARYLYSQIKDFMFFQTFNERNKNNLFEEDGFLSLVMKMKYEKRYAGDVIFKEGDFSNGKVYVVYQGEMAVVVKKQDVFLSANLEEVKKAQETEENEGTSQSFLTEINSMFEPNQEIKSPTLQPSKRHNYMRQFTNLETPEKKRLMVPSIESQLVSTAETIKSEVDNQISSSKRDPSPQIERKASIELLMDSKIPTLKFGSSSTMLDVKNPNSFKIYVSRTKSIEGRDKAKDVIESLGSIKDTIVRGGFFGELALFSNQKRSASIVALTDCELLSLDREDYESLKLIFDRKKQRLIDFMLKYFPGVDKIVKKRVLEDLTYVLEEKNFSLGETIVSEGQEDLCCYIIYEGECQLSKSGHINMTSTMDSPMHKLKRNIRVLPIKRVDLDFCTVESGVFIGDEVLFSDDQKISFSAKVTSAHARVYAIDKAKFVTRFPREFILALETAYNEKSAKYISTLENLLKNKYPNMNIVQSIQENLSSPVMMCVKPKDPLQKYMESKSRDSSSNRRLTPYIPKTSISISPREPEIIQNMKDTYRNFSRKNIPPSPSTGQDTRRGKSENKIEVEERPVDINPNMYISTFNTIFTMNEIPEPSVMTSSKLRSPEPSKLMKSSLIETMILPNTKSMKIMPKIDSLKESCLDFVSDEEQKKYYRKLKHLKFKLSQDLRPEVPKQNVRPLTNGGTRFDAFLKTLSPHLKDHSKNNFDSELLSARSAFRSPQTSIPPSPSGGLVKTTTTKSTENLTRFKFEGLTSEFIINPTSPQLNLNLPKSSRVLETKIFPKNTFAPSNHDTMLKLRHRLNQQIKIKATVPLKI